MAGQEGKETQKVKALPLALQQKRMNPSGKTGAGGGPPKGDYDMVKTFSEVYSNHILPPSEVTE